MVNELVVTDDFKISIIVPTLNRVEYLSRALDSVFNQTFKASEIIVVDNGSSDGTLEFIKEKYPSVTLLEERKRGVSAARNKGIISSKSDWVAFLDSDDAWDKKKLEVQKNALLSNSTNYKLVHTEEVWFKNNIKINQMKKHQKFGGYIFEKCLPLCCISPSSVLIKKKVFYDIGFFDESLDVCEDYDFWLRFCCKYPVNFVDQKLTIKNGGHVDQLSKKYWGMDRFRIKALENLLQSSVLDKRQKQLTKSMLLKKINILIEGAKKRSNTYIYNMYLQKQKHWEAE